MATTPNFVVTAETMASKSASSSVPEIEMGEDLVMSLDFGPPRQLPESSPLPTSTQDFKSRQKIKLIGPSSCWLGPPSLGAGLSRAACTPHSQYSRTSASSTQITRSSANVNNSTEGETKATKARKPSASSTGRGVKRRLDPQGAETKPSKAAKTTRAQKTTRRAAKKATKKAVKKFSELSIE